MYTSQGRPTGIRPSHTRFDGKFSDHSMSIVEPDLQVALVHTGQATTSHQVNPQATWSTELAAWREALLKEHKVTEHQARILKNLAITIRQGGLGRDKSVGIIDLATLVVHDTMTPSP